MGKDLIMISSKVISNKYYLMSNEYYLMSNEYYKNPGLCQYRLKCRALFEGMWTYVKVLQTPAFIRALKYYRLKLIDDVLYEVFL